MAVKGTAFPDDSVVLSAPEAADLVDRSFTARCAAEDVATAVEEGAGQSELAALCKELVELTRDAERLR